MTIRFCGAWRFFRFIGLLSVALSATAAQSAPLRIGYSYWLPNVPLDIAEAQGWFKAAGLEVELQRFATTQGVLAALKAGEVDVASDMIGTWLDQVNRGEPLVILGETDWSHGGDKIVTKAGVDFSALKGQPLVTYIRNLAVLHFLGEHLRAKKLSLSDYRVTEISDDAKVTEEFLSGRVKALVYYDPLISDLVVKGGGQVVATTADYPGVMPEGFAARRAWLERQQAETLVRFFQVWFRAVAYARAPANAADTARLASEKTFNGTQTIKADELAALLAAVPLHDPETARKHNSPGGNFEAYQRKALVTLRLLGQINPEIDFARAIDTRPLLIAAQK